LKRKRLYVVLAAIGTLALFLAGMSGVAVVSAQEPEEPEDAPGGGIMGWRRGLFGLGRGGDWTMFDTVAEELGMTPEELFAALHSGKTLEEVAADQGVEIEAVREAMGAVRYEAMRDAIAKAVEDGDMSQEHAAWLLEGLEKGYMPGGRGPGRGFGRGPGGRGARGGFAPGEFAPGRLTPGECTSQSAPMAPAVPGSSSL